MLRRRQAEGRRRDIMRAVLISVAIAGLAAACSKPADAPKGAPAATAGAAAAGAPAVAAGAPLGASAGFEQAAARPAMATLIRTARMMSLLRPSACRLRSMTAPAPHPVKIAID